MLPVAGPITAPTPQAAEVKPYPLPLSLAENKFAIHADKAGVERFPMKHKRVNTSVNWRRVVDKGSKRKKGVAAEIKDMIVVLKPNLSLTFPPGICARAVATPQPNEKETPIPVGEAFREYIRKAVTANKKTPLLKPEKNCALHSKYKFFLK